MSDLLIFAIALYAAVLASCLIERTAASVSVLFIAVGLAAGPGGLNWMDWVPAAPSIERLATFALVATLYSDGLQLGLRELRAAWRLPGRSLLLGLPLTLLVLAALAHWVVGLPWLEALLLAAVLTPTDPVLVSTIVERQQIALPLRRMLNIEAGINDGLALPIVLLLLGTLGSESTPAWQLLGEVAGGAALGLALPWLARALRPDSTQIDPSHRPMYGLALGLLVYTTATALNVNEYLAAFFAGATLATLDLELRDAFDALGSQIGAVLKLGTLLMFGALLSPKQLLSLPPEIYLFALAALLLARPLGLLPALWGSRLAWPERITAAWFGPKGFASLIYAILVLHSDVPHAAQLYHIAALVIVLSIVLHSSTSVPIARWLERRG